MNFNKGSSISLFLDKIKRDKKKLNQYYAIIKLLTKILLKNLRILY
jgi:hypothetical protein